VGGQLKQSGNLYWSEFAVNYHHQIQNKRAWFCDLELDVGVDDKKTHSFY
jgi:hypothetical protein